MANSFAEQLSNVKLRPSRDKTKDFSDPKLAGFTTQDQISAYQKCAIEANMEQWQTYLSNETFPAVYFPLTPSDAEHFIRIFERNFQALHEHQQFDEIRALMYTWLDHDPEQREWFEQIKQRLQLVIEQEFPTEKRLFAKTSSRSAKDACIFKPDFLDIYTSELSKLADPLQENSRIIALLTAAFSSLCVTSASDILNTFAVSERIYQDLLLATEVHNRTHNSFQENIILRPFIRIDVDMEFRGFVFQRRLTCLSQYNYLIYSQRLCQWKDTIREKIVDFFNRTVKAKLTAFKSDNYVIDFALTEAEDGSVQSMNVWVIELNPFMETTDGALFSWQHERHLLEGDSDENRDKTLFRITEKARPGSWSMLPISIRQWIKNKDAPQ